MSHNNLTNITIIGIGGAGWGSLPETSRQILSQADTIIGGKRHLEMLPKSFAQQDTVLQSWPSLLKPFLQQLATDVLANSPKVQNTCILASGNPMLYGIGASLAQLLPTELFHSIPQPSTQALICANMGWAQHKTQLISVCGRSIDQIRAKLLGGTRLIVLSADAQTPSHVATLLCEHQFDSSIMTIFEDLGAVDAKQTTFTAKTFDPKQAFSNLNTLAIDLKQSPSAKLYSTVGGLPEEAFDHDGQITKKEVRALSLSALSPRPDNILWDIGAGSGSVGIEWMRAAPFATAYAIEPRADRCNNILQNAKKLGVPALKVITGKAPNALSDLPAPDAIFIGGGLTNTDIIPHCIKALKQGGRLVVNTVTWQSEAVLIKAYERHGGTLTQIQISRPSVIGTFSSWQPSRPITQWCYTKPWDVI